MKHKRTPSREYPAGFFTELMRASNFPPGFVPQFGVARKSGADEMRAWVLDHERRGVARPGWANGTLPMPGTQPHAKPGLMRRPS